VPPRQEARQVRKGKAWHVRPEGGIRDGDEPTMEASTAARCSPRTAQGASVLRVFVHSPCHHPVRKGGRWQAVAGLGFQRVG